MGKKAETNHSKLSENSPKVSLVYLLFLILSGALLFQVVVTVLAVALYGVGVIDGLSEIMKGNDPSKTVFLKLLQPCYSIFVFFLPAYVLNFIERRKTVYFDFSIMPPIVLLFLTFMIVMVSAPLLELSTIVNGEFQIPTFLSEWETWMRGKEQETKMLTALFLSSTSYSGLLLNLIVIALLPAIGEEFIFRGILQNIAIRWIKNPHVAICMVAVIFSFMHAQFYSILPRMLMGILFGYLLYWGRNIWLPILGHFISNAAAILNSFILLREEMTTNIVKQTAPLSISWYMLSLIGSVSMLCFFWYRTKRSSV